MASLPSRPTLVSAKARARSISALLSSPVSRKAREKWVSDMAAWARLNPGSSARARSRKLLAASVSPAVKRKLCHRAMW